ncbi:MAG: DUF1835 domain-containing protein [Rhizobiales bacterium]|nr:DUF1835 domain-containing protein [Hyphomicrobiales bacterium]
MTQTIAHFVFTLSGAGNLVRALRKEGLNDQVVATWHDLNFGPIDPSDPSARKRWLEKELGRAAPEDAARSGRDWDDTRFPSHRKVVWLTQRSSAEYAGFLDWLWHRGDAPIDVVDLSEIWISPSPELGPERPSFLATSLASLHHENIRHNKLWELARPLPVSERLQYREMWKQLISENAPIRVIENGKLVSAEASYFDSLLMDLMTDDWQLLSRIVGTAMAVELDNEIINTGFDWLQRRLMTFVEHGELELLEERSREETHLSQLRLARRR